MSTGSRSKKTWGLYLSSSTKRLPRLWTRSCLRILSSCPHAIWWTTPCLCPLRLSKINLEKLVLRASTATFISCPIQLASKALVNSSAIRELWTRLRRRALARFQHLSRRPFGGMSLLNSTIVQSVATFHFWFLSKATKQTRCIT